MFKFTKCCSYTILSLAVFFLGFVLALTAGDRTDPEAVARDLLKAMQENNLDAIFEIMEKDKQKHFSPLTPENRQALETIVKKDMEKIGANAKVTELRKCATLSGKPAIAVKVGTAEDEVYVFILSKEGDIYSFSTTQSLSSRFYNNLELIKKIE